MPTRHDMQIRIKSISDDEGLKDFIEGLKRLGREVKSTGNKVQKETQQMQNSFKKFGNAIASIQNNLKGFAATFISAAAFGGIIDKLKEAINATVEFADQLDKLSLRLGISTQALAEYAYVADRQGVAFRRMTMAIQRMIRRIAEAAIGTGEAKEALRELGIDAVTLNLMKPSEQLLILADAFAKVKNDADKVRLAMKLFDSEGVAMLQVLRLGSKGIDGLRERARELGIVFDKDLVQEAVDVKDAFTDLKWVMKSIGKDLSESSLPLIKKLAVGLTELRRRGLFEFRNLGEAFFAFTKPMEYSLNKLITGYKNLNQEASLVVKPMPPSPEEVERAKLLAKRAELTKQLNEAQKELAELTKERASAEKRDLQELIRRNSELLSAVNMRIQTTRSALAESLRLEQRHAAKISDLSRELTKIRQTTEERIRAIRRRRMTEEELQADLEEELQRRLGQAWELLRRGQLEAAEEAARKAQEVAEAIKDEEQAVDGLRRAGAALEAIQKERLKTEEQALEAHKDRTADLKAQLEELTARQAAYNRKIEELNTKLQEISEKRAAPEIDADIKEAKKKINTIQEELARLDGKVVTAVVRVKREEMRHEGGLVGLFARGGRIPGFGGGDRIRALLEPGEFVIRKEAVRRYGAGLFELLNSLRLALPRIPAPAVPRHVPAFQAGGLVAGAPLLGRLELALPGGETAAVFAPAEEARKLERLFRRIQKTTL